MINPTPIDQLPRFLERVKAAQSPLNRWLPYIIAGSLILIALVIASQTTKIQASVLEHTKD